MIMIPARGAAGIGGGLCTSAPRRAGGHWHRDWHHHGGTGGGESGPGPLGLCQCHWPESGNAQWSLHWPASTRGAGARGAQEEPAAGLSATQLTGRPS
jgi:hypothetical protein